MGCPKVQYLSRNIKSSLEQIQQQLSEAQDNIQKIKGELDQRIAAEKAQADQVQARAQAELERVAEDRVAWEQYARDTFLAHTKVYGEKLRFLQYTTKSTRDWWVAQQGAGAIVL